MNCPCPVTFLMHSLDINSLPTTTEPLLCNRIDVIYICHCRCCLDVDSLSTTYPLPLPPRMTQTHSVQILITDAFYLSTVISDLINRCDPWLQRHPEKSCAGTHLFIGSIGLPLTFMQSLQALSLDYWSVPFCTTSSSTMCVFCILTI